jgi:hypothetical protein
VVEGIEGEEVFALGLRREEAGEVAVAVMALHKGAAGGESFHREGPLSSEVDRAEAVRAPSWQVMK